jgi:hypothetical protein
MSTTVNPKHTIGQVSVDVTAIVKRLAVSQPGDVITYDELNNIVKGKRVNGRERYVLSSARNIARRENRILFGVVSGVGLRRLNDSEISNTPRQRFRRIKSEADKTAKEIACADFSKLTPIEQRTASTALSIAGSISLFACSSSQKRLEDVTPATAVPSKVDVTELARLFSENRF